MLSGVFRLMELTDEHSIELPSSTWEHPVPRRLSDILSKRKSTTNATPNRKAQQGDRGRRATITEARSPRAMTFRKLETRPTKPALSLKRSTTYRKQGTLRRDSSQKRTYVRRTPSSPSRRGSSKLKRPFHRSVNRPTRRESCASDALFPVPSTDTPVPEPPPPTKPVASSEVTVPVPSPQVPVVRRAYTRRKTQPINRTMQYGSSRSKLKRLGTGAKSEGLEAISQENHEAFIKAFAIPTHLYRYLAIRHRERPLYLNRTLNYLRPTPLPSTTEPSGKTPKTPRPSVNSVAERILRERIQLSKTAARKPLTNNVPEMSPLTYELTPPSSVLSFWPQEIQLIFEGFFDSANELDWVTVEASVGLYFRFGWAWRHKPCAADTLVAPFDNPFQLPCHNPRISSEPSRTPTAFDSDMSCRFQPMSLLNQAKWISSSGRLVSGQLELRVNAIERRWLKRPSLCRPNGSANCNGSLETVSGCEKTSRLPSQLGNRKGGLSSAAYPAYYTTAPLPLFYPNSSPVGDSPPFLLTPGLYELRLGVDHGDHGSSDKVLSSGDSTVRRNGFENGHRHETGSTADSVATSTSEFPTATVSSADEITSLNEAGAVSGRVEWRRIRFPKGSDVLDEYSRWPRLKFRVVWHGKLSDNVESPTKIAEHKKCEQHVNGWTGIRSFPLRSGTPMSPVRKTNVGTPTRGITENGVCPVSPQVAKVPNKAHTVVESPTDHRSSPSRPLSTRTRRSASTRPHLTSSTALPPRPVTYRFLYQDKLQQWSEAKDLVCPWCRLDCWRARERGPEALLVHLRTCHPRFRFKASWSPSRAHLSLEVSLNEAYDGSNDCGLRRWGFPSSDGTAGRRLVAPGQLIGGWTGLGSISTEFEQQPSAATSLSLSTYASRISRPVRRLSYTHLIFWRGAERVVDQPLDPTLSVRPVALGHNRVYYHTRSIQPLRACEFDHDSEDEDAPDWLRQHYQRKVEEFTDVNQGEKQLMQLWNALLLSIGPSELVVCDTQLANLAACFVHRYAHSIHRRHLRNNLILHFANLVDYGLLAPGQLRQLVTMYDKLVSSLTPGRVQLPMATA